MVGGSTSELGVEGGLSIIDPRLTGAREMLKHVKAVLPVLSSKGGVGKTIVSTLLALNSACKLGLKTGLLDLDVTNPTAHIVLGVKPELDVISEDRGIIPPVVHGVKFMTTAFFTGENPNPLRGAEVDDVIKEVLATTVWGDLDVLFIDTPPGMGDEVLDVISYLGKPPSIVVATPSKMTIASVERFLKLLKEEGIPLVFLVENMSLNCGLRGYFRDKAVYAGCILFDEGIEDCIGDPARLIETRASRDSMRVLRVVLDAVLNPGSSSS